MATYTSVQAIAFTPIYVTADTSNQKIAVVKDGSTEPSGDDVYEYDVGTDTWTLILDLTNIVNLLSIDGLAYFGGDLFALGSFNDDGTPGADTLVVLSYDGVPDSWTREAYIFNQITNYSAGRGCLLTGNNGLVASGIALASYGEDDKFIYSTDGSSWSSPATPAMNWEDPSGFYAPFYNPHYYNGKIFHQFCTSISGSDCTEESICEFDFSTGLWSYKKQDATYDFHQSNPNDNYCWTGSYQYTDDWVTYNTWTEDARPIQHINMPYSIGIGETDNKIYQWNPPYWIVLDDPTGSHTFLYSKAVFIRMDDGTCYLVAYDTSSYAIFERSEVIAGDYGLTHSASGIPGSILI